MTYVWLDDLPAALEAGGVPYQLVDGWQARGRPSSTGQFNPTGVLCHHTASPTGCSDQSELGVILSGNSEAPGPISQLLLGREYHGLYVVAAGRANHGGSGLAPWLGQGKTDGNAAMIGIEVSNNGVGEYWPDWQTDLYAAAVGALCEWYGYPLDHVLLHHDFSQPYYPGSKCDPAGPWQLEPHLSGGCFDMTWSVNTWRQFISDHNGGSTPTPTPPTPEEDFVAIGPYFIQSSANCEPYPYMREDGEQVPSLAGAVFYSDPAARRYYWLRNEKQLSDKQWWVGESGGDTTVVQVDDTNAFGFFEGPSPVPGGMPS